MIDKQIIIKGDSQEFAYRAVSNYDDGDGEELKVAFEVAAQKYVHLMEEHDNCTSVVEEDFLNAMMESIRSLMVWKVLHAISAQSRIDNKEKNNV